MALLLGITATAQETQTQPEQPIYTGPSPEIAFNTTVDWDDPLPWGGYPPPWFENPATVDCGGRDACEASLNESVTA